MFTGMKNNQTSSLPRDTNAALREVIKTVANVNDIYTEETEALIAIDSQKFMSMQDRKHQHVTVYHTQMSEMIARKDELKKADPTLRSKLKELQIRFHELTERNLEALERMQRCTDKLGQTIRNAAVRVAQSQRSFAYNMNGTIDQSNKNKIISTGLCETA